MKILKINNEKQSNYMNFRGTRTSIKAIEQLAKNNAYSLTEPNQRLIINSIDKLSKTTGKETINFLLNTATHSTYTTSIELEDKPKNDWKTLLLNAAKSVLEKTPIKNKTKYIREIIKLEKSKKINNIEKDIINLRDKLLSKINFEQIENETDGSIKNIKKNLDYFIISSETTKKHKQYLLKKLNYMMSSDYKINPQLSDKKSIIVAEIINDITINTPGNEIPNIKAVNQKQHGICAAISIVRKKLAYEDKPNYIDSILSELDESDYMKVYDRTCLGSGNKVELPKTKVDFNAALEQGYRIIDASAMQWMQAAKSNGYSLSSYSLYTPFDKENFDVNKDAFHNVQFDDENLKNIQIYYQALLKIKNLLEDYKANKIKVNYLNQNKDLQEQNTIKAISDTNKILINNIIEFIGIKDFNDTHALLNDILSLEKNNSRKIKNNIFEYIINEEVSIKKEKIKSYIYDKYPNSKIDEKKFDKFFSLIELNHELNNSIDKIKVAQTFNPYNADKLYNIAAALRYLYIKGIENKSFLKNIASDYNILMNETLIINTIDDYINKIKNNKNTNIILNQLCKNFNINNNDTKLLLSKLEKLKIEVNDILDNKINEIYDSLNMGSKEDVFISYLNAYIREVTTNKNQELNQTIANALNIKNTPEDIIEALDNAKSKILVGDKDFFNSIFNSLQHESYIDNLNDTFDLFIESLQSEYGETILNDFINKQNLDLEKDPLALNNKINEIKNNIFILENSLNKIRAKLKIKDENGDLIYSADLKDNVLKELEQKNIIASKDELQILHNHFLKLKEIDSLSRNEKKDVKKFSELEKNILYRIEKNINKLYKEVKNELAEVRALIKEPLEDLNRIIGVNEGQYYVSEGESGLCIGQSARILEYITGRYHHTNDDVKEVIENIKFTPYSSISSSSVSHEQPAIHAQYIADIAPVKISDDSGEKIKDILYHDNTWGAIEKDNTWIDSNGMVRSDYNNFYGGKNGYLINDNYQNGNFVENVYTDLVSSDEQNVINDKTYKKLRPQNNNYKFARYRNFITEGESTNAEYAAESIQKLLISPSSLFIKNMRKYLKGLTEREINLLINKENIHSSLYEDQYNNLMKSIEESNIRNKEEFDKLSNDNFMKLILEKVALKNNYSLFDKEYVIAKIKNTSDLEKFVKLQKTRAIDDFKYAFNKDSKIINYVVDDISLNAMDKVIEILKKYGFTENDLTNIKNLYKINDKKFDGSLLNISKTIAKAISQNINNEIKNKTAANEIEEYLNNYIINKLNFVSRDIINPGLKNIINFLDEKFNPQNDSELINIYNKIKNMDNDKFKKEVLSKLSDDHLGIKNKTGYDIYKEIKQCNNATENLILNEVFLQDYVLNNPDKKIIISNFYDKYFKEKRALTKLDFSNLYTKMKNNLSMLSLSKLFNEYKDTSINKYDEYPAYPKVDYLPEWGYRNSYDQFVLTINECIDKIKNAYSTNKCYEISTKLEKYCNKFDDNYVMTPSQYKTLKRLLKDFIYNFGDTDLQFESSRASLEALDIPQGMPFKYYRPSINKIVKRMNAYEKNYTKEKILKDIDKNKEIIAKESKLFVNSYIQERYHNKVMSVFNDYKHALIKDNDEVEKLYNTFWETYKKYHILNNPETALDTYLKSLAKDSKLNEVSDTLSILLLRVLSYSMLVNLQNIIMKSIQNGDENIIKSYLSEDLLGLSNGESISIDTPEKVYEVAKYLILDNNIETAVFFIDKLGLNEKFIEGLVSNFNFDELKLNVENYANEEKKINSAMSEITLLFKDIINAIESGVSLYRVLSILKSEIRKIGNNYSLDKNAVRNLIKSINSYNKFLKINKVEQPIQMFETFADESLKIFNEEISVDKNLYINNLADINTIVKLANNIDLQANSKVLKELDKFNKNMKKINDYKDSLLSLQA